MWYFFQYTNTDASALTIYDKEKHTHIFEKSQNTTYHFPQKKKRKKKKGDGRGREKSHNNILHYIGLDTCFDCLIQYAKLFA